MTKDIDASVVAACLREFERALEESRRWGDERANSARRLRRAKRLLVRGKAQTERRRRYLVRELVEAAQSVARAEDRSKVASAECTRAGLRFERARRGEDPNGSVPAIRLEGTAGDLLAALRAAP